MYVEFKDDCKFVSIFYGHTESQLSRLILSGKLRMHDSTVPSVFQSPVSGEWREVVQFSPSCEHRHCTRSPAERGNHDRHVMITWQRKRD